MLKVRKERKDSAQNLLLWSLNPDQTEERTSGRGREGPSGVGAQGRAVGGSSLEKSQLRGFSVRPRRKEWHR